LDEVNTALMGKMAVNDRAESSFAGVTAQIQDYGWIVLANGAAISDMGHNVFLDCPLTKTDLKGHKRGMFYSLSQELQLTAVVAAMEYAPTTRRSNNDAQEKQHEAKQRKKEFMKDEVSFAVIALASRVLVGILHIVDKKDPDRCQRPKGYANFCRGSKTC
jgi:hypothetical protein